MDNTRVCVVKLAIVMIMFVGKESSKKITSNLFKSISKVQFPHFRYEKNQPIPCPKCGYETAETKGLSMSTRTHKFGRQQPGGQDDDGDSGGYYAWQSKSIQVTLFIEAI